MSRSGGLQLVGDCSTARGGLERLQNQGHHLANKQKTDGKKMGGLEIGCGHGGFLERACLWDATRQRVNQRAQPSARRHRQRALSSCVSTSPPSQVPQTSTPHTDTVGSSNEPVCASGMRPVNASTNVLSPPPANTDSALSRLAFQLRHHPKFLKRRHHTPTPSPPLSCFGLK